MHTPDSFDDDYSPGDLFVLGPESKCTRELPKALAPRGHVYEHGRCRQCNVTEPPAIGYGQPAAREGLK